MYLREYFLPVERDKLQGLAALEFCVRRCLEQPALKYPMTR